MTMFYAMVKGKNENSSMVVLESTLYHRAEQEAEDICKQENLKLEYIRTFKNHQKQPGILSKGNIQHDFFQPKKKR